MAFGRLIQGLAGNFSEQSKEALTKEFEQYLLENEEIFYKNESFSINNRKDYGFSIIPLDEIIEKLTLKGFKYETFDLDVERKISRLVSNIITSDECKVTFEKGKMLVILRKH